LAQIDANLRGKTLFCAPVGRVSSIQPAQKPPANAEFKAFIPNEIGRPYIHAPKQMFLSV
jgi:hypothetical protein